MSFCLSELSLLDPVELYCFGWVFVLVDRVTLKVEPCPKTLCTSTLPPIFSIICLQMLRPSPVPLLFIFLSSRVKSVNSFEISSFLIPTPVSLTSILNVMNLEFWDEQWEKPSRIDYYRSSVPWYLVCLTLVAHAAIESSIELCSWLRIFWCYEPVGESRLFGTSFYSFTCLIKFSLA